MDTIEYATFRYGTAEVENGLKAISHAHGLVFKVSILIYYYIVLK